jgi:phosphoglycolate phosphatase-like HAD superfamily hydrolase
MNLCVFDFDGVLFDSAHECLEVAYRTYRGRDESPPRELAERFARSRYLVGPPWQYAVLLRCLDEGALPSSTAAFLELAASRKAELAGFTDAYFAQRARLAAEPRWFDFVRPYDQAVRAFRELHGRGLAVILSTRDDRSISALCAHYLDGLRPVLLPRSGPREKWELLLDAARERGLPPGRVFFLDDYLQHALPARRHGIAAHLATWGYLGPDDASHALTAGLPCLQLSDLDHALRVHEENRS